MSVRGIGMKMTPLKHSSSSPEAGLKPRLQYRWILHSQVARCLGFCAFQQACVLIIFNASSPLIWVGPGFQIAEWVFCMDVTQNGAHVSRELATGLFQLLYPVSSVQIKSEWWMHIQHLKPSTSSRSTTVGDWECPGAHIASVK